jgi:hypothetical protein
VLWLDFIINLIILGMQIPRFPNSHGGRGAFLPPLGRDMMAHHFPCQGFAARGLPTLLPNEPLEDLVPPGPHPKPQPEVAERRTSEPRSQPRTQSQLQRDHSHHQSVASGRPPGRYRRLRKAFDPPIISAAFPPPSKRVHLRHSQFFES